MNTPNSILFVSRFAYLEASQPTDASAFDSTEETPHG